MQPKITEINGLRHYQIEGKFYPSVTTILDTTKSETEKATLLRWQKKMERIHGVEGEAQHKARDRGTTIHKMIETYLYDHNSKIDCPEELSGYWASARQILPAIKNPIAIEQVVWHNTYQYAGTLDLIADWNGKRTLFDWKTSYRMKRLEWIKDHTLQTAAYAMAYEDLHQLPIEQTLIAILRPERIQLFEFEQSEIVEHWKQWLERLEKFQAMTPTL